MVQKKPNPNVEHEVILGDLEEIQSPPIWAQLEARNEARNWNKLDEQRNENDRRWLECYGEIIVFLTQIFAIIFVVSLVIWIFHYIAPICWHWLNPEQLSKIQSILFSGSMGAIISGILRQQLSKT